MPTPNLGDLSTNAANLGTQILDQLKADLLGTLADPESIAMAERATATLSAVPIAMIGAADDVKADLQNQFDAALSVLYSLASAEVENAARAADKVRSQVFQIVNTVIADAVAAAFAALKIAVI